MIDNHIGEPTLAYNTRTHTNTTFAVLDSGSDVSSTSVVSVPEGAGAGGTLPRGYRVGDG